MKKINWKSLFFELIMIFIGISGAFLLDDYRGQLREKQVRINFYESFILELDAIRNQSLHLKQTIDTTHTYFTNNPHSPITYRRDFDFTNNLLIIQSAFEGDKFNTVGSVFLRNIEFGSNSVKVAEKRFDILEEETRRYILQEDRKEREEEKFRAWYLSELAFLSFYLEQLALAIKEGAIPDTQAYIESLK